MDRMRRSEIVPYRLHVLTGGPESGISTTAIKAILNGSTKEPGMRVLRKFAQVFHDPIEVWLEAAGYLDGIESVEQAIEQRYGPLFKDSKMATILTKKGVIEILEVLATVPEQKLPGMVEFIKTYARGIQ